MYLVGNRSFGHFLALQTLMNWVALVITALFEKVLWPRLWNCFSVFSFDEWFGRFVIVYADSDTVFMSNLQEKFALPQARCIIVKSRANVTSRLQDVMHPVHVDELTEQIMCSWFGACRMLLSETSLSLRSIAEVYKVLSTSSSLNTEAKLLKLSQLLAQKMPSVGIMGAHAIVDTFLRYLVRVQVSH